MIILNLTLRETTADEARKGVISPRESIVQFAERCLTLVAQTPYLNEKNTLLNGLCDALINECNVNNWKLNRVAIMLESSLVAGGLLASELGSKGFI